MSFASSVPLTLACARAGILAGWQGGPATSLAEFERYLVDLGRIEDAPAIVNLPARSAADDWGVPRLAMLERHRAPLVLSSVGDPSRMVERVHGWGGRVIQDVTTMRHAEKAIDAGVDGLMLTCAGAGGHSGFLTPFAFVPAVRRIWDGLLIVGGGIADAHGIAAALALGGDLACMGTRFIATPESGVTGAHRDMIARVGMDRIVVSAAMNGVPANWIRDSIEDAGLDPATLPATRTTMPEGVRPWRDIFSAGHSVGLIDDIVPVEDVAESLIATLASLLPEAQWRQRLCELDEQWMR
ncbi:nitronate monooxygenase [Novosphingobium sp. ERN07]|uniref:NAD(P)H-dependent flavin oxidoreductase n=1 Tax=Novosphingobium sp. ERN07 TaxID=2726187 RepID=UPI001457698B|nr:nitronate monooxygenase [Novosphingobium sp. ERN07]NLR72828.1 nitronate monooxygenase [Novosphingobium sp. ERN07]